MWYAPTNANDGQAAITRPTDVGSATATLATRLAKLPATSSVQGSHSHRFPVLLASKMDMDDATTMPSTLSGMSAALHCVSPCLNANVCMWR
jgi:cytochrome bd-type quinol oxidase subunit 2